MKNKTLFSKLLPLLFIASVGDAQNIFVNIRTSGSTPSTSTIAAPAGSLYSAAAPVTGATWNNVSRTVTVPQGTMAGSTFTLYSGLNLVNSAGVGTTQTLTVSYYSAVSTGTRTEPSTASGENTIQPGGVMAEAWRNYLNSSGNYFAFTVSNLSVSTPYGIYFYGGTTSSGQGVGLALRAGYGLSNSPTNAFTTNTTVNSSGAFGALWTVSNGVTNLMPSGTTWNALYGRSDASGVFRFLFNGLSSYAYLNGFQIVPLSRPVLNGLTNQTAVAGNSATLSATVTGLPAPSLQWYSNNVAIAGATGLLLALNNIQYVQNGAAYSLVASNILGITTNAMILTVVVAPTISGLNNQAAASGTTVSIPANVSGVPTPTVQWRFNGNALADGLTGNGSTIAGSSTAALVITNAQAADSGTYSLVASNNAGLATNSMTLTVSSGNVPPNISGPADQTVVQTSNAIFVASVSGLPLPALQWRVNGADIPGETNSSLTITNVQFSQNGFAYSLVATNSAGMVTNSAYLYVLVPPMISQQPTNMSVLANSQAVFNVTAGGVPAVKYQWLRNGGAVANATNGTYSIASAQGVDNGAVFSVIISNTAGVVTSSNATLTVVSATLTGTFLPTNGAANISPDQQLRIVFAGGTPALAYAGKKMYVRDAVDDSLFATIDTGLFQRFTTDSATVSNAFVRTEQGQSFFYMPIAVYSNVAWITLTNRFLYGKTYYVNCDAGLFLDPAGAAFPAVTGTNTWRFSTKSSGPSTPTASTGPTNITVALDGTGDFATLQGASDWIPQNNTLERTITMAPGIYHDFAIFTQNRNNVNIVGTGASRQDVQIIYPNAAYITGSSCGMLRLESSDLYFRNLTLDNQVYLTNSLDNYGPWAGRLNTLDTTGQRLIFDNVAVKGGQDTLYAISGSSYYNHCEIWGSTDFIYGGGLAVFDQCNIVEIKSTGGPCTAPSTPYAQPYGLIFLNCAFPQALVAGGYPYDVGSANTSFMRPWGQDGMTALINCAVGSQISTGGWTTFGSGTETTCRAREAGTMLIGGGAINVPQVRWNGGAYWVNTYDPDYTSSSMSPSDPLLAVPTGTNNRVVVTIDANSYTIPAIFTNSYFGLNGWLPTVMPTVWSQPASRPVAPGANASFTVTATGQPNPSFQWRKNGANLSAQTNATLTITNVQTSDVGTYSVIVSNSAGTVASSNAALSLLYSAPPQPAIPNGTNNVTGFGATGDGVTTNTSAIQAAIDALAASPAHGGTVEIPPGVYLSGPLYLSNSINLQIDAGATLQMLPYGSFPATSDFISASKVHDVEISGGGMIDGQGADWWATNNAAVGGITRPKAMFAATTSTNVLVRDVTLQNPPNTHISFRGVCVNVTVNGIDINTPDQTPNTDGIDCSGVNVLIENSHISDGDDHIALGDGHVGSFNHDITVAGCVLGTGHGVSIGSYTQGGLSNLLVTDCIWTNGSAGIKVKSDIDRGGLIQNLRYQNLTMTNTQIPIYFTTYYTNSGTSSGVGFAKAAGYPVYSVSSTTPIYKNILVSNLVAVPATGYSAGIIWGRPEMCISNIVLDHVNITASKYFNVYNAKGVQFVDSQITAITGTNFGLFNADLAITNRSPSGNLNRVDGITTNGYGNSLSLYDAQSSLRNTNALDDGPLTLGAGILTVSNNLALGPSTVFNYSLGTNAATVVVKGNLQLGGTITVSAGAGFSNAVYTLLTYTGTLNGGLPALGTAPAGYGYTFSTATAGQVNLIVAQAPASTTQTNLSFTNSSGQLQISWPGDHIGWRLESQTNSLAGGLGTNWFSVFGSDKTNQMSFPINRTNGSVFFRLAYP